MCSLQGVKAISLQLLDPWHTVALVENILMVWPSGYDDGIPGRGSFNCSHSTGPQGPICDPKMRAENGDTFCYPSCPLCDPQNSCDWSSCADDKGFIRYLMEEVVGQWYAALCQAFFCAICRKLISPKMAKTHFTKAKTHFTRH